MSTARERELMRQVRGSTERTVGSDPNSFRVKLRGGPVDGFVVTDSAAALRDDWYTTWPPHIAEQHHRGYYVLLDEEDHGARIAEWREHDGS